MEKNALSQLFSTEEQLELKQSFKEIVCEHLKNDLENMDCYLFDPSSIEDMIQDVIEELRAEVKSKLKVRIAGFIDNLDIEELMNIKK